MSYNPATYSHLSNVSNPHTVGLGQAQVADASVDGEIDANSNKITNVSAPTVGGDAANKTYVDGAVTGLDWQESILDKDLVTPPGAPTTGDRYIIGGTGTGDWATHDNKITEWNGSAWVFITLSDGQAVWVTDEDVLYVWNTTDWVKFGSTVTHANLSGLQGGTTSQYFHMTNTQHTTFTTNLIGNGSAAGIHNHAWSDLASFSGSSLADLATTSAADLASGNLNVARMPTGGSWALSSDLNIDTNKLVVDQTNSRVGINVAAPVADLDVNGGVAFATVAKTATYTATVSDHVILCDGTSAPFTVTLPAVATSSGLLLKIKKTDSTSNAITLDGNASETIDGATTVVFSTQYQAYTVVCDGSAWHII